MFEKRALEKTLPWKWKWRAHFPWATFWLVLCGLLIDGGKSGLHLSGAWWPPFTFLCSRAVGRAPKYRTKGCSRAIDARHSQLKNDSNAVKTSVRAPRLSTDECEDPFVWYFGAGWAVSTSFSALVHGFFPATRTPNPYVHYSLLPFTTNGSRNSSNLIITITYSLQSRE